MVSNFLEAEIFGNFSVSKQKKKFKKKKKKKFLPEITTLAVPTGESKLYLKKKNEKKKKKKIYKKKIFLLDSRCF